MLTDRLTLKRVRGHLLREQMGLTGNKIQSHHYIQLLMYVIYNYSH